jgi:hypothetical protein
MRILTGQELKSARNDHLSVPEYRTNLSSPDHIAAQYIYPNAEIKIPVGATAAGSAEDEGSPVSRTRVGSRGE